MLSSKLLSFDEVAITPTKNWAESPLEAITVNQQMRGQSDTVPLYGSISKKFGRVSFVKWVSQSNKPIEYGDSTVTELTTTGSHIDCTLYAQTACMAYSVLTIKQCINGSQQ